MTKKTRYFVVGAATVLVVGVGGGLVAYLMYTRGASVPAGLPPEIRFVPANAEMVAYANVKAVFNSEFHRQLMSHLDSESRKGRQMMHDFAGVDLQKQVDHVVMYVEPFVTGAKEEPVAHHVPRASLLVSGTFDEARIEQAIREKGGELEQYNGHKVYVHEHGEGQVAVGFVRPGLIALGQADLVRRAIDHVRTSASATPDITENAEVMPLIRDNAGSTAWVVGRFDEVRRRMNLPEAVAGQVPPIRFVSAKANINGGVKATLRADTGDEAAAQQLRDVTRGFLSLAQIHGGGKTEVQSLLKSIELTSNDKTVRLSFAVSPEHLRALTPRGRGAAAP